MHYLLLVNKMRKIFYQIIIIVLIATCLFLVKDDFISAIKKVSSFFNKNNGSVMIKFKGNEEVPLPSKIDMPGALRVVDNILGINKTELSSKNIIDITNEYRKENGISTLLAENSKLNLSAEKKIKDMFDNQYFEHISKTGVGVGDQAEEVGYEYILIGENLAMGNFKDDKSLVDAWMASPGHRVNILNKNYTEIGVAVGKGRFEGKDVWMAVQHFGTPRSVCPEIDDVLYGTIMLNQKQIDEMESDITLRLEMINRGVLYEGSTPREQINKYNLIINSYNNLIKIAKEKINNYNEQIRAFNVCLLSKE